MFHAVPGNGKVVQRQVADKSLSRKTAYIMYVYIYITYSDIVDNAIYGYLHMYTPQGNWHKF